MDMRVQAASAVGDMHPAPGNAHATAHRLPADAALPTDDATLHQPSGDELATARARSRLTALVRALASSVTGRQVALSELTHDTGDGYRPAELLLVNGVPMDSARALRLRVCGRVVEEQGNSETFTLDLLCPDFPLTLEALPSGGVCRLHEAGEMAATVVFTLETFGPPPTVIPVGHHPSCRLFARYAGADNAYLIARLSVLPDTAAARGHPGGNRFATDADPAPPPHRLDDNA